MATLKDVELSKQESKKELFDTAQQMSDLAVSDSPKIEVEYTIFKMVNTKRKGRVYIDGIDDDIENPVTKKRERIWLLSGTSSIWSSDLVEQLKDKDFVRNNRRSLQFEGGILRVPSWDVRQLEFIRNCRHLIDNRGRKTGSRFEFFEYNPAKQQEEALKKRNA